MKNLLLMLFTASILSNCMVFLNTKEHHHIEKSSNDSVIDNEKVNAILNQWHRDVAHFNFDDYFGKMTENAIFIGTDASENWTVQQFKEYAKPHFDKKKTWDFKVLERNVYQNNKGEIAWFDELLETQMGVCRGSGVLSKKNNVWKIEHYVLSIVIPNEDVNKVVAIKKEKDSQIIQKLKNN